MSNEPSSSKHALKVQNLTPRKSSNSIRIVDAENDFPFLSIDFMRVGSAHQVCDPSQEPENAALLERIINHLMSQYEPSSAPHQVVIEHK